jgi:hypothetical protein
MHVSEAHAKIWEMTLDGSFSTRDLHEWCGCSLRTAQRWVKEWEKEEIVEYNHEAECWMMQDELPQDIRVATPSELVNADLKVAKAEAKAKEANNKYKQALKTIEVMGAKFEDILGLEGYEPRREKITLRSGSDDEIVPLWMLSDWHAGEGVDPITINGLNEFNPDICLARWKRTTENMMYLTDRLRAGGSTIDTLLLWWGGDFMNGWIHDEYLATNTLTPMEEMLFAADMLKMQVEWILDHGKFKRIRIVCNPGNHGRDTQKKLIGIQAKTSKEWAMYHFVERMFRGDDRVEFTIADGYMEYLDVMDTRLAFHHGESIRGGGGVGGLTVPLRRAILKMNELTPLDQLPFHIMGHFHQLLTDMRSFFVNGSGIGMTPYGMEKHFPFEPAQQAMCLLVPGQRTPCEFKRVWCDE